ncbi:MAG TPA: choice-of-anchor tandem repeat GloVer-containing protein [Terriglobales bacterium]|nr:choice-of-anchor tandem repeat GloVer-containing protein [Terriglobales bacterium]
MRPNRRWPVLSSKVGYNAAVTLLLAIGTFAASNEKVLYSFSNYGPNGPLGGLILDNAGNLYGTASYYYGAVFELSPAPGGAWTEQTLYEFTGGDGFAPSAALVFDNAGNLYGTTLIGGGTGCGNVGCGTVFELSPVSAGGWTEAVLYRFTGGSDGGRPSAPLILDAQGNVYGTTTQGGDMSCGNGSGCGTVFELSPGLGGWTQSVLYAFAGGQDGSNPYTGVIFDKSGNLYGTTAGTGSNKEYGTVFKLTASGHGPWKQSVLHRFKGGRDGAGPIGEGLIWDAEGNLYGTTGGGESPADNGTVFEMRKTKAGWTERVLYRFAGGSDGAFPQGVTFGKPGHLYGTTLFGGPGHCFGGCGTVFRLVRCGNSWTETVAHDFEQGGDGQNPAAGLVHGKQDEFFGTTPWGGANGVGSVFEVKP